MATPAISAAMAATSATRGGRMDTSGPRAARRRRRPKTAAIAKLAPTPAAHAGSATVAPGTDEAARATQISSDAPRPVTQAMATPSGAIAAPNAIPDSASTTIALANGTATRLTTSPASDSWPKCQITTGLVAIVAAAACAIKSARRLGINSTHESAIGDAIRNIPATAANESCNPGSPIVRG